MIYQRKTTIYILWLSGQAATDIDILICRASDGYFYDFADDTFKASGWTDKDGDMTLIGENIWKYAFNLANITNETVPDVYQFIIRRKAPTPQRDFDGGQVYVPQYLDRLLGLLQENFRITNPVFDANNNMTSCTLKIYPTATDCENDTNAIATYTVTATYSGNNLASYKVKKV